MLSQDVYKLYLNYAHLPPVEDSALDELCPGHYVKSVLDYAIENSLPIIGYRYDYIPHEIIAFFGDNTSMRMSCKGV